MAGNRLSCVRFAPQATPAEKKALANLEAAKQKAESKARLDKIKSAHKLMEKLTPVLSSARALTMRPEFATLPAAVSGPISSDLETFAKVAENAEHVIANNGDGEDVMDMKDRSSLFSI